MNKYTKIGAIAAMLSVALGAFGAHILEDRLSEYSLDVYGTGVQYHMFHSVGILLVALFVDRLPSPSAASRCSERSRRSAGSRLSPAGSVWRWPRGPSDKKMKMERYN